MSSYFILLSILIIILVVGSDIIQSQTVSEPKIEDTSRRIVIESLVFRPEHILATVGTTKSIAVQAILSNKTTPGVETFEVDVFCPQGLTAPNSPIQVSSTKLIFGPLPSKELFNVVGQNENFYAEFMVECIHPVKGAIVAINESSASGLEFLDSDKTLKGSYLTVDVEQSKVIDVVAAILGWLYFIAWTVSFYPQLWILISRRSVVGLDFNYIILTLTGFVFYSVYNCTLLWNKTVQAQYFEAYQFGVIPVQVNDVFFSLHAAALVFIYFVLTFIFERGGQKYSCTGMTIVALMFTFAIVTLILAIQLVITWLTYIEYLSYMKLGVTLLKYIPQVWLNFKRKSTDGFSKLNILLDSVGGLLSLLQMILIAYNFNSWNEMLGNFAKFGLGCLSLLFDGIFFVQFYMYYDNDNNDSVLDGNDSDSDSDDEMLHQLISQQLSEQSYGSIKSIK